MASIAGRKGVRSSSA